MLGFGGFGIAIVLVMWAVMIRGIGRIAMSRGRNPYGWAVGGVVASGLGIVAGAQLGLRVFADTQDDVGLGLAALSLVLPVVGMMIPMGVLAFVLAREPIKVTSRDVWQVHFIDRGRGTLRISDTAVRLEWSDGAQDVARSEILGAEPDGECVRIRLIDREIAALLMGKPDSPEGRRQQSRQLAMRLRSK